MTKDIVKPAAAAKPRAEFALPMTQRRQALLADMPPELQKIADKVLLGIAKTYRGTLLNYWVVGGQINTVLTEDAVYGDKAIDKLAAYTGVNTNMLYDMRNMNLAYSSEALEELVKKEMPDGRHISFDHIRCLTKIKAAKDREKLTKRVFSESLSAQALALEIEATGTAKTNVRGGGRKPGRPGSPVAGAQQIGAVLQTVHNRCDAWQAAVFDPIDTMPMDDLDAILLDKLKYAKEQFETVMADGDNVVSRLAKNIARTEKAVAAQRKATVAAEKSHAAEAAALEGASPRRRKSA